jgi:hypothetical protein
VSARDFGSDTTRDYLVADPPGAVTALTGYSMLCLMRPHNGSRSGTFAALSGGGAFTAQMIIDGGKWFGGGDFGAGYTGLTPVANHWIWAGLSHQPGSSVYRWHHRDITAAGANVHGSSAFAVANPGAIATIRLGDGNDEAQCDIALAAFYATNFADDAAADAFFDAAFTLAAADAFAARPLGDVARRRNQPGSRRGGRRRHHLDGRHCRELDRSARIRLRATRNGRPGRLGHGGRYHRRRLAAPHGPSDGLGGRGRRNRGGGATAHRSAVRVGTGGRHHGQRIFRRYAGGRAQGIAYGLRAGPVGTLAFRRADNRVVGTPAGVAWRTGKARPVSAW